MYRVIFAIFLLLVFSLPICLAQGEVTAKPYVDLNVRAEPAGSVLATLPKDTTVIIEGRNAADWVLIHTQDSSIRGWVAFGYLIVDGNVGLADLPIVTGTGSTGEPAQPAPEEPAQPAPEESNPEPVPAGNATGTTSNELNVRQGPGQQYDITTSLSPDTLVIIEGRNTVGDWVLVHTQDENVRGWVASRFLYLSPGVILVNLPDVTGVVVDGSDAPVDTGSNAAVPASANEEVNEMLARLEALPLFYNFSTEEVRYIFAVGKELGNRPNVFTKVGDSITANQPFMGGFGSGEYDLGGYGYLQDTINFFSAESPREGIWNSFVNPSLAAHSAFNAGAVLDVAWADQNLCVVGEAPLLCEYRLVKPAVAIILLGSVDIQIYEIELYTQFLDRIVDLTIDAGIIPVLTTFPISPDYIYWEKSLRFNMVILDIAERRGIPVINLWLAAQDLPGYGLDFDRFHLSLGPTYFHFNGEEKQWGVTLRNLLSLQALDELRKSVPLQ